MRNKKLFIGTNRDYKEEAYYRTRNKSRLNREQKFVMHNKSRRHGGHKLSPHNKSQLQKRRNKNLASMEKINYNENKNLGRGINQDYMRNIQRTNHNHKEGTKINDRQTNHDYRGNKSLCQKCMGNKNLVLKTNHN
jgi:hypothetical protein